MSEEKKIHCGTEIKVSAIVWEVIRVTIGNIFAGIVAGLLAFIPVIGWIAAVIISLLILASAITMVFNVIGMIVSTAKITDDGVCGRSSSFSSFELTFNNIQKVTRSKGVIVIHALNAAGKKKKYKITGKKNAHEFCDVYGAVSSGAPVEAPVEATEAAESAE